MKKNTLLTFLMCLIVMGLYAQNLEVVGKAKITVMDTVTSATANVVRQEDGTLAVRQYKIGDLVHGGIVFWVDETGEHGLVAATVDQSDNAEWGLTGNFTGANRDNIYSGMMNTERIIINQGNNAFAADLCALYSGGGYGDWYLPSKEELNLMWENLHRFGCPKDSSPCPTALGGFESAFYWSSTEDLGDDAWRQDFSDGDQFFDDKDDVRRVRAVRAF